MGASLPSAHSQSELEVLAQTYPQAAPLGTPSRC